MSCQNYGVATALEAFLGSFCCKLCPGRGWQKLSLKRQTFWPRGHLASLCVKQAREFGIPPFPCSLLLAGFTALPERLNCGAVPPAGASAPLEVWPGYVPVEVLLMVVGMLWWTSSLESCP